jgi:S-adenosyl-L-methionine hydrolase (adenosine-forming)
LHEGVRGVVVIALFTDFGTRDAYVAQLKGAILSLHPTAQLVDLSHEVGAFDVRAAAYLLDASARYFPTRTIFVAVVDPGVGTARRPVLLATQAEKFYVGPDNGLFTRVLEREGFKAAYVLTQSAYFLPQVSATFHGRDLFGPVAAHLARGVEPAQFGPCLADLVRLPYTRPQRHGETVIGEVIHLDHYGNIATNIPSAMLSELVPGQWLALTLADHTQSMPFVETYGAGPQDQCVCLINSNGEFEMALPRGNAAVHLEVRVGARVVLRPGRADA